MPESLGFRPLLKIPFSSGGTHSVEARKIAAFVSTLHHCYEVESKLCGACGFNERCWNRAERNGDAALVPDVDQNLARTLDALSVRTRKELLRTFDVASLSDLKRPFGNSERRVGRMAERILQFAEALERREEKVLTVSGLKGWSSHPSAPSGIVEVTVKRLAIVPPTDRVQVQAATKTASTNISWVVLIAGDK